MTPKMELAAKIVWYYLLWMLEGVFLLQLIVFLKRTMRRSSTSALGNGMGIKMIWRLYKWWLAEQRSHPFYTTIKNSNVNKSFNEKKHKKSQSNWPASFFNKAF